MHAKNNWALCRVELLLLNSGLSNGNKLDLRFSHVCF
jgi:hypothetical protein